MVGSTASSRPTGVTREGLPNPGGSNGLCTTVDASDPGVRREMESAAEVRLSEEAKGAMGAGMMEGGGGGAGFPLESFELELLDSVVVSFELRTFSSIDDSMPRFPPSPASAFLPPPPPYSPGWGVEYSKGGSARGKSPCPLWPSPPADVDEEERGGG